MVEKKDRKHCVLDDVTASENSTWSFRLDIYHKKQSISHLSGMEVNFLYVIEPKCVGWPREAGRISILYKMAWNSEQLKLVPDDRAGMVEQGKLKPKPLWLYSKSMDIFSPLGFWGRLLSKDLHNQRGDYWRWTTSPVGTIIGKDQVYTFLYTSCALVVWGWQFKPQVPALILWGRINMDRLTCNQLWD